MFDILNHKEKANQNYTKILPHPSQIGYYQENKKQMVARIWGKRNPHTLLVGI
jgi:hypothetical protein